MRLVDLPPSQPQWLQSALANLPPHTYGPHAEMNVAGVVGMHNVVGALQALAKWANGVFTWEVIYSGEEPEPRIRPAGLPPGTLLGGPRFLVIGVRKRQEAQAPPLGIGGEEPLPPGGSA